GDAIAHPARVVVEQVRRHDLEIVVGGVGERASPVTVAQGPDALDVGAELIVGHDVAAPAHGDAGPLEAEVVGVGTTAHRQQDVGPHHLGRPLLAVHPRDDVVAAPGERDALAIILSREQPGLLGLITLRGLRLVPPQFRPALHRWRARGPPEDYGGPGAYGSLPPPSPIRSTRNTPSIPKRWTRPRRTGRSRV